MILFVVAASGILDSKVVVDVVVEWSTSLRPIWVQDGRRMGGK